MKKTLISACFAGVISLTSAYAQATDNRLYGAEYTNALDMANLSSRVYDDLWDKAIDKVAPYLFTDIDFKGNTEEYVVVRSYTKSWDGFDAKLYYNTELDNFVMAFRGTQAFSVSDWMTDIAQILNDYIRVDISQYVQAVDIAKELKLQYGDKLQFTGHSLGGGLAQVAGLATATPTTCFEAAGITADTYEDLGITKAMVADNSQYITHINVQYDPLSDFDGQMNSEAPFYNTLQHGSRTIWLDNMMGTGGRANPLRVVNHFYHTFVYKLTRKDYAD
jgi:hypothetical protein